MTKRILNAVLLTVGLLLLYFFIAKVGFREVGQILKKANLIYCFLGVSVYICAIAIHSRKWFLWSRILRPGISYKEILPFYLVNSFVGNLTPFKGGEASTPFLFNKFLKVPIGRGFSMVLLDRFSELAVFAVILFGSVFYLLLRGLPNSLVLRLFLVFFVFLIIFLGLILLVLFLQKTTLKVIKIIASLKYFSRFFIFLEKEILQLYSGVAVASKEKIYGKIIGLTILAWVFELGAFYLIFLSVSKPFFLDVLSASAISSAASMAAFIPGGFGVGEISAASVLSLMGYPLVQMAGSMILTRIFLTGVLFISGLFGFFFMKEKITD